jgi:mRNA interferase RelE/StbE
VIPRRPPGRPGRLVSGTYRRLADTENTYRIRIGEYRVVYSTFDQRLVVEVIRVRDRKDEYK